MSSLLVTYVQKWEYARKNAAEETIDKVLKSATNGIETILTDAEEIAGCVLKIFYSSQGDEIEVDVLKNKRSIEFPIFQQNIKYGKADANLEYILKRIMEEFKTFPQLQVEREDFRHSGCIYDVEYYIIISLK